MFLDKIIKSCLYVLVFFVPVFFLPWTVSPLNINKQMFVTAFVFLLLLLWLFKTISSGKIVFRWSKISSAVLVFFVILGFSVLLSKSKIQSFWGMNFESDTFYCFILYGLGFFLFSSLLEKKDIKKIVSLFILSAGILSVLFLLPVIFKVSLFSWDFTKPISFSPIGSIETLSIFLGGAFVSLLVIGKVFEENKSRKKKQGIKIENVIKWILGALIFACIILINFKITWVLIGCSSVLILWLKLKTAKKTEVFDFKKIILPLIILVISFLFVFIRMPIEKIVNLPVQTTLDLKESMNVAANTLKETDKTLILGSGPATFSFQYDLFRSLQMNYSAFWNFRFDQSAIFLLTILTTAGVLGLLAILGIIFFFCWEAFALKKIKNNDNYFVLIPISFLFLAWFLYPINFTLAFFSFVFLGLFIVSRENQRQFSFIKPMQKAFSVMLICVFLIVIIGLSFHKLGKIYIGAIDFSKGLDLLNSQEPDIKQGIGYLTKAAELDSKDLYLRNLSYVFLLQMEGFIGNQNLDTEEKNKLLNQLIANIENPIKEATLMNPANSLNWLQRGIVYENLSQFNINKAEQLAIDSYEQTKKLSPQNPQISFNLARIYKLSAEKVGGKSEYYEKYLEQAEKEIVQAIQLKNNFLPAYQLKQEIENLKVINR